MSNSTTLKSILSILPENVEDFVATEIPTIYVPSLPTDEESSILAMGYEAYNWCSILKAFEGLAPVALGLRLGQLSNSALASVILKAADRGSGIAQGGVNWVESFKIEGDTTSTGRFSSQQGIDSDWLGEFNTYTGAVGSWLLDCFSRINACQDAMIAGDPMPYTSAADLPEEMTVPVPIDPSMPPALVVILSIVKFLVDTGLLKVISHIVSQIIKRIGTGGDVEPFVRLFKKFAFLKEDDVNQGFEELTSLLLVNSDKPIEIINSLGEYDLFLDNVVDRGEEP